MWDGMWVGKDKGQNELEMSDSMLMVQDWAERRVTPVSHLCNMCLVVVHVSQDGAQR